MDTPKNSLSFRLWGRQALFTDPITRVGGEKCSYPIPTYEALKGVLKSIYWKPTFIWVVDAVRVIAPTRLHSKGMKPLKYQEGGNDLAYYTYLQAVEYQVQAHFEWNLHRPELANDRIEGKHFAIAQRMLDKGGRQDIFLGTRDCQGYVAPCTFGEGSGCYDSVDAMQFGRCFHSFGYPDETGGSHLESRFWLPEMQAGVIRFPHPESFAACPLPAGYIRQRLRPMTSKPFGLLSNLQPVSDSHTQLLAQEAL